MGCHQLNPGSVPKGDRRFQSIIHMCFVGLKRYDYTPWHQYTLTCKNTKVADAAESLWSTTTMYLVFMKYVCWKYFNNHISNYILLSSIESLSKK